MEELRHPGNMRQQQPKRDGTGGGMGLGAEEFAALVAKNPALENQKNQERKRIQAQGVRDAQEAEQAAILRGAAEMGVSPEEFVAIKQREVQLNALRAEQAAANQANMQQYPNPNRLTQIPGY